MPFLRPAFAGHASPAEAAGAQCVGAARGVPVEADRGAALARAGIAYIRFNVFPGDPETVAAVTAFMTEHASAKVIIFDNRTHHGGGLDEMNAMFPYLFAKPATLVAMDTRASNFDGRTEARDPARVPGPRRNLRHEHFVVPSTTRSGCSEQRCSS